MGAGDTACLFFLRLKILKTFCFPIRYKSLVTRRYDDFRVLTSIFVIGYFNYGVLVRAVHRSLMLRGASSRKSTEKLSDSWLVTRVDKLRGESLRGDFLRGLRGVKKIY